MNNSNKSRRRFIYRVNTDNVGPRLLMEVFEERGWTPYDEGKNSSEEWNLWWRTTSFPVAQKGYTLKSWQYTNHIPKSETICKKDNLARVLKRLKNIYGDVYDITPTGYQLPLEYRKLVKECHKKSDQQKIWICKPVGQSQGRGISIFRHLKNLHYDSSAIVQQYIHNPLLISGYKFDLRLYVCVPSFHPLTIYLYRDGLVRFATDKYSLDDLVNPFSHLTNTTLNRQGPRYSELQDEIGPGCKWNMSKLRTCMRECQVSDWLMWQRVSIVVTLTILSMCDGTVPETANNFCFYGFDVLIDEMLKPWLLEVNLSPALGNYCPTDSDVKKSLLHDLFDLMGLPSCNSDEKENEMEQEQQQQEHERPKPRKTESLPVIRRESAKPDVSKKKWLSTKLRHKLRNSLAPKQLRWGNGVDWSRAVDERGDWSKIYPINDSFTVTSCDSSTCINDKQIKCAVNNLIRLERACVRIYNENQNLDCDELSEMLAARCKFATKVWLPND